MVFAVFLDEQLALFENGQVGFCLYAVQAEPMPNVGFVFSWVAEADDFRHNHDALVVYHEKLGSLAVDLI